MLSFAAMEAVLEVRKNVIVIKGVNYRAVDNEFQEFIYDTSERDRPVIAYETGNMCVTFQAEGTFY